MMKLFLRRINCALLFAVACGISLLPGILAIRDLAGWQAVVITVASVISLLLAIVMPKPISWLGSVGYPFLAWGTATLLANANGATWFMAMTVSVIGTVFARHRAVALAWAVSGKERPKDLEWAKAMSEFRREWGDLDHKVIAALLTKALASFALAVVNVMALWVMLGGAPFVAESNEVKLGVLFFVLAEGLLWLGIKVAKAVRARRND
ncbi:MAG: hypothetical protein F8N36_14125 [Desulfovibrio sp.]|uniref:hypothetical protein n=1 Tax=Desulfovibrio sp. TaxID=885 RepID=UPI00135D75C4|nr:hypothetical protein [Desulfovibrio sp.]MTJ93976.1 hypothetical protein [Desulfovibrio sp.]